MKLLVLRVAALLFAAAPMASAEPRKIELNALVARQCGPPGFRTDSGCEIEVGHGTFTVSETVRLGACTTTTVRNSVTIRGRGAGLMTAVPRFPTAGTTLQWTGPPGGVMFDVCGASFFSLRDLTIDALGAGVAIRLSADNAKGAISHFPEIENVVIQGSKVGVEVTGSDRNDQTDFVTLRRVSISRVDVGYDQDSQQSVGGRLETVEVVARKIGYRIRGGSLDCDGCYVGSAGDAGPDFIAFHLTRSALSDGRNFAHHQISIAHSHLELRVGRFVVDDSSSHFPTTLLGNSYSMQCSQPGCEMRIVDASSSAPLVMIGDVIQASSNPPVRPKARVCYRGPELIHLGVHKKPEVSELIWDCPAAKTE